MPDHLMWVWRCFWRLHADRPWHAGGLGPAFPGRIAWRDVLAWAEVHDMTRAEFGFLDRCIVAMDEVYCEWQTKQSKAAMASARRR